MYCIGGGASWPIWATSPVGRALINHGVMPLANDLVVQLGAKLDQFQSDMNQVGDIADAAVARIEQSFANLNPQWAALLRSVLPLLVSLNRPGFAGGHLV